MKNFRWWPVIGLAAASVALSGCGGSGGDSSSSNVSLRVVNATLTHASLDLLVNSASASTAIAADAVSTYVSPASGSVTLQLNDAGSSTALATTVPTLAGGNHYTLLAYESGGAVKTLVLNEDFTLPATGVATLRIVDAATEAGKLDVYITTNQCTDLTAISPVNSFSTSTTPLSFTQGAGSYNVCITALGSKTDLRASVPVTLAGQQVVSVVLTPASGGQLLNGSVLVQQGAYTAARNTNARVRLASAVSGGARVSASASNGKVIEPDPGSVAPAFGFYVLVPATSTLNISVEGNSIAAPATALKAGADSTLLVYTAAAGATAVLLDDDNRLPTDPTTIKLRLINGVNGSAGTLTLTANTAPVGINVARGAASGYATVAASANPMNLTLTSSTNGTFPANTSNTLNANGVYTVLAGGDISAPQLLIR